MRFLVTVSLCRVRVPSFISSTAAIVFVIPPCRKKQNAIFFDETRGVLPSTGIYY
jgi:UPF0716 family protein affecting phage T7 exclusion